MMISPISYIEELKDNSFEQLIAERDSLIQEIKELEKIAFKKGEDRTDPAWQFHPGPDVRYQMNLEYLAELCSFILFKQEDPLLLGGGGCHTLEGPFPSDEMDEGTIKLFDRITAKYHLNESTLYPEPRRD